MDCKMVVKEIVSRLSKEEEKLEWWFEQDIDDEGEENKEGDGGSELEDVGELVQLTLTLPGRDVLRERKDWNEKIHHHFHQWDHPTDEMRMDDLEWWRRS
ncbi:hypothetical protein Tco_1238365 [Tanacetum coccineum]